MTDIVRIYFDEVIQNEDDAIVFVRFTLNNVFGCDCDQDVVDNPTDILVNENVNGRSHIDVRGEIHTLAVRVLAVNLKYCEGQIIGDSIRCFTEYDTNYRYF